jgi:hypothetical protein
MGETVGRHRPDQLLIRCSGQRVRRQSLKPYGRVCGAEFVTTVAYRSRTAWVELARTAGWKVSPLNSTTNSVIACCPACSAPRRTP